MLMKIAQQGKQNSSRMRIPRCRMVPTCFRFLLPYVYVRTEGQSKRCGEPKGLGKCSRLGLQCNFPSCSQQWPPSGWLGLAGSRVDCASLCYPPPHLLCPKPRCTGGETLPTQAQQ